MAGVRSETYSFVEPGSVFSCKVKREDHPSDRQQGREQGDRLQRKLLVPERKHVTQLWSWWPLLMCVPTCKVRCYGGRSCLLEVNAHFGSTHLGLSVRGYIDSQYGKIL